jgi:hypothetical protein
MNPSSWRTSLGGSQTATRSPRSIHEIGSREAAVFLAVLLVVNVPLPFDIDEAR